MEFRKSISNDKHYNSHPSGTVTIRDNVVSGSGPVTFTAQWQDPGTPYYYNDLYINAMEGVGATVEDFRPVAGGPVDFGSGLGAEQRIQELLTGGGSGTGDPTGGGSGTDDPDNTQPDATDDNEETDEDAALTIQDSKLLANDSDSDGDPLTIVSVGGADHGTTKLHSDGSIIYTPDANFNGTDSFTYSIGDGNGGTDTATVTVTVNASDDAPVAKNDAVNTRPAEAVVIAPLANDTDPDGDPLSVVNFTNPTNGNGCEQW